MAEMGNALNHSLPTREAWIDAQLPPRLAIWLRTEYGVNAVHVEELGLLRAPDPEIFTMAKDADRAVVILTKDDDFQKLLTQHGPPPQIIWVRCGNVGNQELRSIVNLAWPRISERLAAGEALVEIHPDHV